jgi:hypothetical protein
VSDSAATEPDFVAEHAREGIEWLRKLSVMQSRHDLIEKFDRMARAVEALLAEHEASRV